MLELNMIGKPCPIPVIEAKKALAIPSNQEVSVRVDNLAAVQNLEKMAMGMGYGFRQDTQGEGDFLVVLSRENATLSLTNPMEATQGHNPAGAVILLSSDYLGKGSEELGRMLMKGFIFALAELPQPPKAVVFMNKGVSLVAQGAATVEDLRVLEQKGCLIQACGTCLNYYDLLSQLAVGEVVDMYTIVTLLTEAERAITL